MKKLLLFLIGILLVSCVQEKAEPDAPVLIEQQTLEMTTPVEQNITATEEIVNAQEIPAPAKSNWWKPKPMTSWQWQLTGTLRTNYDVDMYDVDLFDTSKEEIKKLQTKGIKVVCYFSAGSYEDWRDDAENFPKEILGSTLEGWEDERWLDVSKIGLLAPIMRARLDLAAEKGCDGVEPDNVDGYQNDNGFSLTAQEQLAYNKWLAEEAHKRSLSIGLKNDLDQIPELVDHFDFAVNEQCFEYDECERILPFIENDKAVFGVEYELEPAEFCERAKSMRLNWLKMEYDLDGGRISCDD